MLHFGQAPARQPAGEDRVLLLTVPERRLLVVAILLIGSVIAIAGLVHAPDTVRTAAVFAHLIFLTIGFGGVLILDWYAVLWLLGRLSVQEVVVHAHRSAPVMWVGVAGLTLSGALLAPRFDHPTTWVKIAAVLGVTVVGVLALGQSRRIRAELPIPSPLRIRIGAVLTVLSQLCWWIAVIIGYLNHEQR